MAKPHLHYCTIESFEKAKGNIPEEGITSDLADSFKVFADPTRLKILFALKDTPLCVCDLSFLLEMSQSSISHQLRTLREAKLVKAERDGKFMVYSLDDSHVHDIIEIAKEHILESR